MTARLDITVQNPADCEHLPDEQTLRETLEAGWESADPAALTLRIVDAKESQQLNHAYRQKERPTNILSFPFDAPPVPLEQSYAGDLVACCPIIAREAAEQQKNIRHHWQHLLIHGILHLQGYDHISDQDATLMEAKEISILARLGVGNPYQIS